MSSPVAIDMNSISVTRITENVSHRIFLIMTTCVWLLLQFYTSLQRPIIYPSISPSKGLSKIDSIWKGRRGKKMLYLMSTVSTVGRIYIRDNKWYQITAENE